MLQRKGMPGLWFKREDRAKSDFRVWIDTEGSFLICQFVAECLNLIMAEGSSQAVQDAGPKRGSGGAERRRATPH